MGSFLVLAGVLVLLQDLMDVNAWLWFTLLAVGGLVAMLLYIADRSDTAMLATTYVFLVLGLLVGLIMLNALRDEGVAVYILSAMALPYLALFGHDQRKRWALIPAYVFLTVALMIGLLGTGLLGERAVPAFLMSAIAVPFYAVYGWDRRQRWAVIPAGVMTAVTLVLLAAEAAFQWVLPVILILTGAWIVTRTGRHRHRTGSSEDSQFSATDAERQGG